MNLSQMHLGQMVTMMIIMSTLFSGCGSPGRGQKFETKLQMGRRAVAMVPLMEKSTGFQLTPNPDGVSPGVDGIIEMKSHPLSTEIQWINFDPNTQPRIKSENFLSHGLSLVDKLESLTYVSATDLNPLGRINRINDRLVSVSFERVYRSLTPVRDCYFEAIYWDHQDGTFSLRQVNNNTLGRISIEGQTKPHASWTDIQDQLPFNNTQLINARPIVYGELSEKNQYQFIMATEFTAQDLETKQIYTLTVENGATRILEAYGHRLHAAQPFAAQVFKRSYKESTKVPKVLAEISIAFPPLTAPVVTSLDGLADPGQATTANFTLSGPRVSIINNTGTAPMVLSSPIKVNSSSNGITVEPAGPDLTAFNAYASILQVNQFVRRHVSLDQSPYLTYKLPLFINVNTDACNAFFDPTLNPPLGSVALFAAGMTAQGIQCANMADINDVGYHEWGHGFDNSVGLTKAITDGAFSEGIGDIISAYLTDSSQMAEGFFVANNNPIRSLQNTKVFPASLVNLVHEDGLIIGGAFWDLRQALIANHGKVKGAYISESLFFRHLLNTDSYRQSYQNVVLLDDNDGNPATRSPNFCAINGAFAKHGLAVAENCTDTPDSTPKDGSIVIATQTQVANGVTLMAATSLLDAESLVACLGNRTDCEKDKNLPRATLAKEGLLGDKVSFVTTTPITIKAMDVVTMWVYDKDNKVIGSRMFKYVNK